jgi:hypothetical protein
MMGHFSNLPAAARRLSLIDYSLIVVLKIDFRGLRGLRLDDRWL